MLLGDDGRVRVVDFGLALPPLAQEATADSGQSSGLLAMVASASDPVAMAKTGSNPRLPAIIVAATLVALRFAVSLAFRRQMRGHRRYERLGFLFAVAPGYILVGRIMGYVAGLLRSQYLTLEPVGLAALMLIASLNIERRIKRMALPSLLVSIAIQAWPAARPHIIGTYFPLLALSTFLLMLRAPTLPDDPPSDLPSKSPHQ